MRIFTDDSPIYLQLRQHIEELILDRTLTEDEAIPSLRTMARDYNLNPITIGNALSSLVEEGILHKRRGVGFFVSPDARKLIISMRGKDFLTEKLEPVLKNARQLELPKEQIIQLTERIYGENHE